MPASSRARTWARAAPLAGVGRCDKGMPSPSVRLWLRIPLPFPLRATPSLPPVPGGKSAVDGSRLPVPHPAFFCHAQHPRVHRRERPRGLPAPQPAGCCALRRPWGTAWDIAPATPWNEDRQHGLEDLANRALWHPTPACCRLRRHNVLPQAPRSITQSCKSSCQTVLLLGFKTVWQKNVLVGWIH